jgi:Holliday junction resolvasome RuvABC endonuclease subunit
VALEQRAAGGEGSPMSTVRVLGLDLSKRGTGWAFRSPGGLVSSGVQAFHVARDESPGMLFVRFRRWLNDLCRTWEPDLVAYERPFHRGGSSTEILIGFATRVQEVCAAREIEHAVVPPSTLKLFATGRGNASKTTMVAAARRRWPDERIQTDDQADALWVMAWAVDQVEGAAA